MCQQPLKRDYKDGHASFSELGCKVDQPVILPSETFLGFRRERDLYQRTVDPACTRRAAHRGLPRPWAVSGLGAWGGMQAGCLDSSGPTWRQGTAYPAICLLSHKAHGKDHTPSPADLHLPRDLPSPSAWEEQAAQAGRACVAQAGRTRGRASLQPVTARRWTVPIARGPSATWPPASWLH